jgi:hypothetical protein
MSLNPRDNEIRTVAVSIIEFLGQAYSNEEWQEKVVLGLLLAAVMTARSSGMELATLVSGVIRSYHSTGS